MDDVLGDVQFAEQLGVDGGVDFACEHFFFFGHFGYRLSVNG